MGLVTMSSGELERVAVLTEVLSGRRGAASATAVLGVSVRQMLRLLLRYQRGGGGVLIHRTRGR